MITPAAPRPKPGDDISAAWANALADCIDRNRILIDSGIVGLNAEWTPSGIKVWINFPEIAKCIQVDGAGISAFNATTKVLGKGTCRIWDVDASTEKLVDSTIDITVYNSTLDVVAPNKWGQFKYIDGVPMIDVASCA